MKTTVAFALLISTSVAFANDWPQWRGPDRTAVSAEKGLLQAWPPAGLERVWTSKEAGRGFGGPAIIGDRVFILGALGGKEPVEHIIALDGAGKRLWATPIAKAYDFSSNEWSLGPNSTPAVDGHFLYALGSQGVLICVDDSGKEIWRKDLVKDLQGRVNPITGSGLGWGFNWSPLVADELVIIAPGGDDGLLAALNKTTGALVWRSKTIADDCTYSSPVLATIGGILQVVYVAQNKVYGVALKDGAMLWTYEKKRQAEEIVAATPIIHGADVLISGSAAGTEMFRLSVTGTAFRADTVWDTKTFANLHGGMVLVNGHVYGSHETRAWKCFDLATGKDKWESAKPRSGAVVFADGCLYCVSQDDDTVSLIEASPKEMRLKGQFKLPEQSRLRRPSARLWTHPVVANGRLYLRDQEIVFCYSVKG